MTVICVDWSFINSAFVDGVIGLLVVAHVLMWKKLLEDAPDE